MTRTSYLSTVRRLAEETPDDRNRVADLLRVVSILVVVFGHWLMAAVPIADGELVPGHLLILADWTHPLTWVFQVMPVFFLVGGYSNALSWRSARRRNESYGTWLRARLRRLILPVVPLLVGRGGVAGAACWYGLDDVAARFTGGAGPDLVPGRLCCHRHPGSDSTGHMGEVRVVVDNWRDRPCWPQRPAVARSRNSSGRVLNRPGIGDCSNL